MDLRQLSISPEAWDSLDLPAQAKLAPFRSSLARVQLIKDAQGWALVFADEPRWKPFRIDFNEPSRVSRMEGAGKEILKQALGPGKGLHILDATAGLCRDSLLMAAWGHQVQALEKDPLLHFLAEQAALSCTQPLANWSLEFGNAVEWLPQLKERPDLVYLDPMYPSEGRTAAPRKELRALQMWLGTEVPMEQDQALFEAAWDCASKRILVKRPLHGRKIVSTRPPSYMVRGASARIDVYLKSS